MYFFSTPKHVLESLVSCMALGLMVAACSNAVNPCIPVDQATDLNAETARTAKWQLEIGESVVVRVVVANDLEGNLAPRAIFTEDAHQRVAVVPLEQLPESPVYIAWVDDEIPNTLRDGQPYTTIHAIGYVSPALYPGRKLFTANFTFEPTNNNQSLASELVYRASEFQDGVFWYPTTNTDLGNHRYLMRIRIETEESLATNAALPAPHTHSEWKLEYDPVVDIKSRLTKLSDVNWTDITSTMQCLAIE